MAPMVSCLTSYPQRNKSLLSFGMVLSVDHNHPGETKYHLLVPSQKCCCFRFMNLLIVDGLYTLSHLLLRLNNNINILCLKKGIWTSLMFLMTQITWILNKLLKKMSSYSKFSLHWYLCINSLAVGSHDFNKFNIFCHSRKHIHYIRIYEF